MKALIFKDFEKLEQYHSSKELTYGDSDDYTYEYTALIHEDGMVDIYENGRYFDTFDEVEDYNNIEI